MAAVTPEWLNKKLAADGAYRTGKYADAAALYSAAMEMTPLKPEERNKLRGNRCLASCKSGDWKQAIEDAKATIEFEATAVTPWYRLGISLLSASLPSEAHQAFEVALELKPGDKDAMSKLAKAKQDLRASLGTVRGPLKDDGDNQQLRNGVRDFIARNIAIMRQKRLSQEEQASTTGSEVPVPGTPAASPRPSVRRESSTSDSFSEQLSIGDLERTDADGVARDNGSNSQLAEEHKAKGTSRYKSGDYRGAHEAYSMAASSAPNVPVHWANCAAASLMLGNYRTALDESMKAVKLDPTFARGHQRAAKALLTMGRFDEAKEKYEALQRADSSDASSREALATVGTIRTNLVAGNKALAKQDARIALWHADTAVRASHPPVEPAKLLRVKALSALGRHSEALADSRGLTIEGSSSHPEVLAVRASALYAAGNMQLAERVYQEALRMDPDSATCRTGIKRLRSLTSAKEAGNEAFKQGRWADAHERYSAAVSIDPDLRSSFVAQCFCNRAAAASKLGRHEEAAGDASKAIEFDPDFAKAYLRRATAHRDMEDYEAAIRDYEKVKKLAPDTPQLDSLLRQVKSDEKAARRAGVYKVLGVTPSASQDDIKKAYKRMALKLHPDKVLAEDREAAEVEFKKLTAAYNLLSDPDKRQKFDAGWSEEEIEQGFASQGGGHGFGGGYPGGFGGYGGDDDMSDLYAHLFANMRRQNYSNY